MNSEQLRGKWKDVRGAVKVRWDQLTDDDLEVIEGDRDRLIAQIEERYGISEQEAQKQVEDWMRFEISVHPQDRREREDPGSPTRKVS